MKTTSKILRTGFLAVAMTGLLLPIPSEARPQPNAKPRISIELGDGPPALRVETYGRPPSRRHVWVPGHWEWSRRQRDWTWEPGQWKVPPRGRGRWMAPTYERGRDGWTVRKGRWERDRDNDGRSDRHEDDRGHDHDGRRGGGGN